MARREERKRLSLSIPQGVDATSLLLKKLTPKLIKSASELAGRQDDETGTSQPGKSADESDNSQVSPQAAAPSSGAQDVPDWYEELSDDHITAFKEVFDMLDPSHTGTLNADSLFGGLRRVDSEITREEVEDVLKKLDKDGNGVIDFDEFLFHISHGAADSQDDDENARKRRGAFTKRQRLFYSAITEFHLKRTLADIQRAQMARVNQPHVLSHYTAGARLIGLTDRQLANEMKRMHKNMKQQDSPYAKPLQLVVSARGHKTVRKAIRPRGRKKSVEVPTGSSQVVDQMSQMKQMPPQVLVSVPSAGPITEVNIMSAMPKMAQWAGMATKIKSMVPKDEEVNEEIRETVRMLASKGSVVAKLPDVNKILELKGKLAQDMANVAETEETPLTTSKTSTFIAQPRPSTPPPTTPDTPPPPIPSPPTTPITPPPPIATPPTTPITSPIPPPVTTSLTPDKSKKPKTRGRRTVTGWTIPRVDRDKVPLPVLKIKYKQHRPTIEDLPNIREKASQAIDDYYESLRKATVQNAWDHWDKLYSHRIRSHKLMENFREVYRAYSPHKEEEAFVVCPWIPGPFRHVKHNIRCHTAGYYYPYHSVGRHRPTSRQQASRTDHRLTSGRTSRTSGRTSRTENRPVSAM